MTVLAACLALLAFLGPRQEPAPIELICPPCGGECHFKTYTKAGNCGGCGMELVPLASVPQVGVLLFEDAALLTSTLTLGVFAGSNAVRAFTVADTAEPLRLGDALELRPQFAFADAPALDVLVVPDGHGAWEDELIVEWVRAAAARARCVLAVGSGSLVLARAGFLAGERVPGARFLVERGPELAPGLTFDASTRWRQAGKFYLARDPAGALDAALAIVQELAGTERAQRTAAALGHAWTAPPPAEK